MLRWPLVNIGCWFNVWLKGNLDPTHLAHMIRKSVLKLAVQDNTVLVLLILLLQSWLPRPAAKNLVQLLFSLPDPMCLSQNPVKPTGPDQVSAQDSQSVDWTWQTALRPHRMHKRTPKLCKASAGLLTCFDYWLFWFAVSFCNYYFLLSSKIIANFYFYYYCLLWGVLKWRKCVINKMYY